MVLNGHTPYDDPTDEEEEWEFLNSDDTTPNDLQLELAEQLPTIAVTTSTGDRNDVQLKEDAIATKDHTEATSECRQNIVQDNCETNSRASTAGKIDDVAAIKVVAGVDQPLEEEENTSITSGTTRNSEGVDSAPPHPQQHTSNNTTNDHPLRSTWNFLENTFQGIDNQHQLRRRTSNSINHINQSVQNIVSNITDETQRVRDQADVHARNASTHVSHAASSVRQSISRANAEYKLSEKVATVAVIGGATLLALGNPRAGVTALAVAGASLAVGEVYEESNRNREEYGLPEGVHID